MRYVGSWTHQRLPWQVCDQWNGTGSCCRFLPPAALRWRRFYVEPGRQSTRLNSIQNLAQISLHDGRGYGLSDWQWTFLVDVEFYLHIERAAPQAAASSVCQSEDRRELTVTVTVTVWDQGRQLTSSMSGLTVQVKSMPEIILACNMDLIITETQHDNIIPRTVHLTRVRSTGFTCLSGLLR